VDVAVGREQVRVAGVREERVEAARPGVEVDRLGVRAVDELHGGAALQLDGRRAQAVDDELAPAAAERALTQLLPAAACASLTTDSTGGGRRKNAARAPRCLKRRSRVTTTLSA
jgi:hypothetical protein